MGRCRTLVTCLIATALIAGCGSGGDQLRAHLITENAPDAVPPAGTPQTQTGLPIPTPGPTGIPAASADVAVIRGWSSALARGDLSGAARYFAIPSVMIYGPEGGGEVLAAQIQNRMAAVTANEALPCGARFISADQRGRYVNALFRLTSRPGRGGGCGTGAGLTARTNFVIAHGQIVQWIRAPDDPGDNRPPASPSATPNSSATL
jgi:hypothetical protein